MLALLKTPGINPNVQVPDHGGTPLHGSSFHLPELLIAFSCWF